jgi:hypothetical protein
VAGEGVDGRARLDAVVVHLPERAVSAGPHKVSQSDIPQGESQLINARSCTF